MNNLNKVEIIAEIANAHQGDYKQAIEIAQRAIKSKADSIKFQIYFADELLVKTHSRFSHFEKQAFNKEQWTEIFVSLKETNIKVYTDIFGFKALELSKKMGVNCVKIHSSDLSNIPLVSLAAQESSKIFLSVGGATFKEINEAISAVVKNNSNIEIVLLYGYQVYPTPLEETNLNRIKILHNYYNTYAKIGYMDHVDAENKYSKILPLLALPYGVAYVEKHITLDRSLKGVDYYSSLEPSEFEDFVNEVRLVERILGNDNYMSESEIKYREQTKKKWVFKEDLSSGNVLDDNSLVMKRSENLKYTLSYELWKNRKLINFQVKENEIKNSDVVHKKLAVVVARLKSSRLTRKALKQINDETSIEHLVNRLLLAKKMGIIDNIAFCTTTNSEDDELIKVVEREGIATFRGDELNVLNRMMVAINKFTDHDIILRVTGDDILVDPDYMKRTIDYHLENNYDYTDAKSLPSGTEVEVFNRELLQLINDFATDRSGTEYLTNYVTDNKEQFKIGSFPFQNTFKDKLRLTMDTEEDYIMIRELLEYFEKKGKKYSYSIDDIYNYFIENPDKIINKNIIQHSIPPKYSTALDWEKHLQNILNG